MDKKFLDGHGIQCLVVEPTRKRFTEDVGVSVWWQSMITGFDIDAVGKTRRCVVASIYEDAGSREALLGICNSLVWKFQDDLDFEFGFWRFKYLADPEIAMGAAQWTIHADLILLAMQSSDLPGTVQRWIDGWLPKREASDGALVLVQSASVEAPQSRGVISYLRLTASRAHLDYLRLRPPENRTPGVDAAGAAGHTVFPSELSRLMDYGGRPVDWGINE